MENSSGWKPHADPCITLPIFLPLQACRFASSTRLVMRSLAPPLRQTAFMAKRSIDSAGRAAA